MPMSLCDIIWYFCRFFIWRYVESVEVLFFARIPHTGQGDKPRDSRLGLVIFIRSTFIVLLLRPGKVVSRLEFTAFSEVGKVGKNIFLFIYDVIGDSCDTSFDQKFYGTSNLWLYDSQIVETGIQAL